MTKHTIVNFQLARSGVAMIAGGASVMGILLAAAGYLGGLKSTPKAPLPATPAPVVHAPPAAVVAPPATAQMFSLRAKTVFSEADAKAEQAALKAKEIDSVVVPLPPVGDAAMFAIDIGRYSTHDAALEAAATLAEKEQVRTAVVPAAPLPKPPG